MFVRHIVFIIAAPFLMSRNYCSGTSIGACTPRPVAAEPEPPVDVGTVIVLPGATGDSRYSSPAIFTRGQEQPEKRVTIKIKMHVFMFLMLSA